MAQLEMETLKMCSLRGYHTQKACSDANTQKDVIAKKLKAKLSIPFMLGG